MRKKNAKGINKTKTKKKLNSNMPFTAALSDFF